MHLVLWHYWSGGKDEHLDCKKILHTYLFTFWPKGLPRKPSLFFLIEFLGNTVDKPGKRMLVKHKLEMAE